ncbi:VOC family protein [Rufibacter aurantiacus]|uniref:VOC family protein n=1 Tax=Rufibacter aurantiacus TaxID=2817374 RepID=UPI001B30F75D|nr:hypothetical protein [Rufibacter aurantiacus]
MMIQRLHLSARNLPKQRYFYTQTLGLALLDASQTSFTFQAGASRITFEQAGKTETPHYHFAFNIPENQLTEAKAWLQSRTSLLAKDGADEFLFAPAWNAEGIYFQDLDGNVLEFICRHNLATATAAPFGVESIICVSEVGLVAPEVAPVVGLLAQTAGMEVWQEAGPDFKALGTETGLFILVKEGRSWFPTQLPAKASDLQVIFRHRSRNFLLKGTEGTVQIKELIQEKEEILA